jgi:hypothetical protein
VAGTGDIYGQVIFDVPEREGTPFVPGSRAKITVRETSKAVRADKQGLFRLRNLPPGTYSIVARKDGHEYDTVTSIDVRPDSVSIISQISLEVGKGGDSPQTEWKPPHVMPEYDATFYSGRYTGTWARRAPTGTVTGRITNPAGPVENATVMIEGTPWRALTDEGGRYRIEGVLPGKYYVFSWTYPDIPISTQQYSLRYRHIVGGPGYKSARPTGTCTFSDSTVKVDVRLAGAAQVEYAPTQRRGTITCSK